MSLLSNPQATPERVFAMVQLLRELGGRASSQEVSAWMQPRSKSDTAVKATLSAARGLGLITDGGSGSDVTLAGDCPADWESYADFVHATLAGSDRDATDADMFEVLSWLIIVGVEQLETTVVGGTAVQCAGKISDGLRSRGASEEARKFNDTKLVAWIRWMTFLGLGFDGGDVCHFVPFVADRMGRELKRFLPPDQKSITLPVKTAWSELHGRMPYLDGGNAFMRVAGKGRHESFDQFSYVSSVALVELQRRSVIEAVALGDSVGQIRLADGVRDVSTFKAINEIIIKRSES